MQRPGTADRLGTAPTTRARAVWPLPFSRCRLIDEDHQIVHVAGVNEEREFYKAEGLNTEVYDLRAAVHVAGSPEDGDIQFYRELAKQTGDPVLDVGCGTGRVAIELARDGHEVVGVDLSSAMLARAEQRRAALPPTVAARLHYALADMTALDLDRQFGLVITPFRSFQAVTTPEGQRAALSAMRAHLRPDGLLVLDLFDPRLEWCVPTSEPPDRRRAEVRHPTTGNRVTFEVATREPDPQRQLIRETWLFQEFGPDGQVLRSESEVLTLRWSLRSEMRLLFEIVGLEVVADYGDFRGGPPGYGREQVWVLRKAGP